MAWIAVILAIVALVIAWMAYNRTGEDLESRIQSQVNETIEGAQQGTQDVQENINQDNQDSQGQNQQGNNEPQQDPNQQTDNNQNDQSNQDNQNNQNPDNNQ